MVIRCPTISAEDGEALNLLSLFRTSCGSLMTELASLAELDNVPNLRAILFKLPLKLREKRKSVAIKILRRRKAVALLRLIPWSRS